MAGNVAKGIGGILGGIGGAMQGFCVNANPEKAPEAKNYSKEYSDIGTQIGNAIKEGKKDTSTEEKTEEAPKEEVKACSDVGLKQIYGDDIDDKIIENFALISAIDFSYKPEAQDEYDGDKGVDDKEHIGVIAQELEKNPVTEGTVTTNINGDKEVDTRHLTFADTAAIAELSRRVLALEEIVKQLQNK